MSKTLACLTILLIAATFSLKAQTKAERSIRGILLAQQDAWNRGDVRAFTKGYYEDDSLVFLGKKGPVYGYKPMLENYLKSYPDTAHMGVFTSTVVQMKKLGKRHYLVIGKWHLKRSIGDVQGFYSLLFEKIKGRWQIIVDHTS